MKNQKILIGIMLIIVLFALYSCVGCLDQKVVTIKAPYKESIRLDTLKQSKIEFPPDFPDIKPLPDHIPKGEIIVDGWNKAYLFDDNGKFIGIRSSDDYKKTHPVNKFFEELPQSEGRFLIEDKKKQIHSDLNRLGFPIPLSIINNAIHMDGGGFGNVYTIDTYSGKIVGYYSEASVYFLDKDNCKIGYYSKRNVYNYKGELKRKLTEKDIGLALELHKNLTIGFSSYDTCGCGYEARCKLNYHRFNNFETGFIFDFNPVKNNEDWEETALVPQSIILKDSLVQFTYINYYKQIRVITEPYEKKVYIKHYNLKVDFEGKYQDKFYAAFGDLLLPDGSHEEYKNYQLIPIK